MRIGFEDLVLSESDADFNDLIIDVTFAATITRGGEQQDFLMA